MRRQPLAALVLMTAAAVAGVGLAAQTDTELAAVSTVTADPASDTYDQPFEPPAPVDGMASAAGSDDSELAPDSDASDDGYAYEEPYADLPTTSQAEIDALEAQADARALEVRASGQGTFEVPEGGIFDCIAPWYYASTWSPAEFEDYAQCLAAM